MHLITHIIGISAGVLSIVSFFPQIHKIYTSKSAKDLSYGMLTGFLITSILWAVYGLMTLEIIVFSVNVIILLCSILLFYLKKRYS